jgi:hypothetical protein
LAATFSSANFEIPFSLLFSAHERVMAAAAAAAATVAQGQ